VLSLLLTKDSSLVKHADENRDLPIYHAASNSSLDVIKFLHNAYLESLSFLDYDGETDRREKVGYLCNYYPTLIHQRNECGFTPLHDVVKREDLFDIQSIKFLCNLDESVVRDEYITNDANNPPIGSLFKFKQLPLHLLIMNNPPKMELSDEGNCFRLFLRIYPGSAGLKDDCNTTPYNLAAHTYLYGLEMLSVYFRCLLLADDPTIDPVERRNLNYADGMFLAFKALFINGEPTIWSKLQYKSDDLLAHVLAYL
jgi:hypothetical protein